MCMTLVPALLIYKRDKLEFSFSDGAAGSLSNQRTVDSGDIIGSDITSTTVTDAGNGDGG